MKFKVLLCFVAIACVTYNFYDTSEGCATNGHLPLALFLNVHCISLIDIIYDHLLDPSIPSNAFVM